MKGNNKNIVLFEGVTDISSIRVYCKDREEALKFEHDMHENGWTWSSGVKYILRNNRQILEVTFKEFNREDKTFTGTKCKETGKNIYEYSKDSFGLMNKILNREPSYEPRKITRTLESLDKTYPFRIKTEEEMVKDFGEDWRDVFHEDSDDYRAWWTPEMNMILGKVIIEDIHRDGSARLDGWCIIPEWMTENKPIIPSYKPRKFNRTFESFNKDTYEYGSILFKVRNDEELRKIVTFFHDGLGVESESKLEDILSELFTFTDYEGGLLLVAFDHNIFGTTYKYEVSDYVDSEFKTNSNVFTFNDLPLFNKTPDYSPRRISRNINEARENKEPMTVIFKIMNMDEATKVKNELKRISGIRVGYNTLLDDISLFPNWLFIDFDYKDSKIYVNFWSNSTGYEDSLDDVTYHAERDPYTNRHIYQYSEIHDFIKLARSYFGIPEVPNYKPRKIERTLESISHRFPFKEIGIRLENEDELIEVQEGLNKLGDLTQDLSDVIKTYPNYLFVDVWYYEDTGKNLISYLSEYDVEDCFRRLVTSDSSIYQHMFSLSEWNKVVSILKHGREKAIPSYEPKKTERTLESSGKFMYDRVVFEVKNQAENIHAQKNLFKLGYSWSSKGMSVIEFDYFPQYLFTSSFNEGQQNITHMDFRYEEGDIYLYVNRKNREDHQNICPTVFKFSDVPRLKTILKIGAFEPNYLPKKIERTLESVDNIPYDRVVFVVRSESESKRVQDYLFSRGLGWADEPEYREFSCYPQLIWVYFKGRKSLSSSSYSRGDYSDERVISHIKIENMRGERVNPILFKASDVVYFDSIRNTGGLVPSYAPRKTNREI